MVVPPELTVMLVSATPTPPTIPPKVVVLEDFALRMKAPLRLLLKRIFPAPVSIVEFPFKTTVLLKVSASFEVEIFTPTIAALATINALSKLEEVEAKVTPVPPAVSVVVPVMVPPPETAFTVIVPAPTAVMFNDPAAVMRSSSASVRLKPIPAVPKNTSTPELLEIPIAPVTFIAAPIEISFALETVSEASSEEFPRVPMKVMFPVPAVRPRLKGPLSVPPKLMFAPPPPMVLFIKLFVTKVTPLLPKLIASPELLIVAPTLEAAFPPKVKPPSNKKVSPPLPRVTLNVLRKSTF